MGQVPDTDSLLLIGDGRLAQHLGFYFEAIGLEFHQWSRRQGVHGQSSQQPWHQELGGAEHGELESLLNHCDRVLLAISDDAIEPFLARHRRSGPRQWVHFSGCLVVEGSWSAHPLCTFSGPAYSTEFYQTIPFVIEQRGPELEHLIPGLKNPSARLPRDLKPLYHAVSVMAGNFTQTLWDQMFRVFDQRLDLDPEVTLPFLRRTAGNLESTLGREQVVTGPVARGDVGTIEGNLAALRGARLDSLADVYESFVRLAEQEAAR